MAAQVLDGIRVIELGDYVSAAYATKLLADLGAEVIKVERPGRGDESRHYGPFPGDEPDLERSGLFLYLNMNKLGVSLDPDSASGKGAIRELVRAADVVVENYGPSVAEGSGLTYGQLREVNPALIMLSLSPYGHTGPYRDYKGYEINTASLGGIVIQLGLPGRPPLNAPQLIGHLQVAVTGALAAMIALVTRDLYGVGQHIDLAESDSWATFHTGLGIVQWLFGLRTWQRHGRRFLGGAYPNAILPCRDGDVRLQAITRREWERVLEMMGNPEWGRDPRFQDRIAMNELYADELDGLIGAWLGERTKGELLREFYDHGVPSTPVNNVADFVHDPHLKARDFFIEVEHPRAGVLRYPGKPYHLSETPGVAPRPAPLLGQHNEVVLGDLLGYDDQGLSEATLVQKSENGAVASPMVGEARARGTSWPGEGKGSAWAPGATGGRETIPLPFEGIRVLDFGWVWAGAVLGHVLADMGAEVIKVESHRRLDPARQGRPIVGDTPDPEQNPLFHNANRGKMSITVDIKQPKGRAILENLVRVSDIVIENMSPHAMEAAGLNYTRLRGVNPCVIMVSCPLAGQTGPFNELRGYGNASGALVGLDSLGGDPDATEFCGFNHALGDPTSSQYGIIAVLAALHHRLRTGKGQYIDLSMWETVGTMMGLATMDYAMNGRIGESQGNRHPVMAPHGIYPCQGDDSWVSIAVKTQEEWEALRSALGNPQWAEDETFAEPERRRVNRKDLDRHLSEWTSQRDAYDVMETLQRAGVAAMPCLNQEGRYFDPHLQARECYVDVEHPVLGSEPLYGIPYKLSETPGRIRRHAPLMGEHNDHVLGELLGLPTKERMSLTEAKVLY